MTRLPAIYGYREHVDDGGLISYGVDLRYCFRRGGYYVHKILNGLVPGDLPEEPYHHDNQLVRCSGRSGCAPTATQIVSG